MPLTRVTHPGLLTDRVFETIHAAIMNGDLPAGTQLKVRDLAAQVGTSVMPVREAIKRLEESGLASREPHRGSVVKSLTLDELLQTYQVRTLLEVEAARLGGDRVTDADCTAMAGLIEQLQGAVTAGDVVAALDLDEAVLTVLYAAGGNDVLVENIRGLWQRCRAYKLRGAQSAHDSDDHSLWTFQPRLLTAALARDAVATADITRESMLSALGRIETTLAAPDPV